MTQKDAKAGRTRGKSPQASAKGAVTLSDGKGRVRVVYSFGDTVFKSTKVQPELSHETLEQSRVAMRGLGGRLLKPGFKLSVRKGVPKFYADEADPAFVVREIDGKRERGRFENGQFKAVA